MEKTNSSLFSSNALSLRTEEQKITDVAAVHGMAEFFFYLCCVWRAFVLKIKYRITTTMHHTRHLLKVNHKRQYICYR